MSRTSRFLGFFLAIVTAVGCGRESSERPSPQITVTDAAVHDTTFVGSKSCRDCHAEFHRLWSTSHHGLAMQPYTAKFAEANLMPQKDAIAIGKRAYRAEIGDGCVHETGPNGPRKYPIAHVMGGKNVYYLLTPMDRGRLQVLPVAYDVHKKAWYDMAASGVRHFPDRRDEALDWTDRMFAFNTTCFNCHVTELSTNFDLATDTYHTTWSEPGISCESCHGSAKEHVRAMEAAMDEAAASGGKSKPITSKDLKIIRTKEFTPSQMNDMCATCHAKLVALSLAFKPGDKFFDHFDLITLEHADFYPDGRDLGENYTHTSWLRSPCAKSGKLDCNHCHTPSGRMRFEGEKSNQMCMPCHERLVKEPALHGHHAVGSKANDCVGCHMPMTRFAAMGRTDHSMRPPTPPTTIAFQSPNACNLCHADHDAAWANEWVRKWYKPDYQAEPMRQAELIDAARKRQWKRLPEMLGDLKKKDTDEVYKNSLVRLLAGCDDASKWPVLLAMLQDPSPLVRSSAAAALGGHLTPETIGALLVAASDESRLVRIRVAMALAALKTERLRDQHQRAALEQANGEFVEAMQSRPDDWASHGNLGNFFMESRDFPAAIACFETATKLEPRQIGPMVNAAMAYSNLDMTDKAEACLRRALKIDPAGAAANFNLGLLLGEQGRLQEAEKALRTALKSDPGMAAAAYNLAVLLGQKNLDEALDLCQKAHQLRPDEAKYTHTLAYFRQQKGDTDGAIRLLRQVIRQQPAYLDAYMSLGEIYENRRDFKAAEAVYRDALSLSQLPLAARQPFEEKINAIRKRDSK